MYTVNEFRKKQLELLNWFLRICEEYRLTYFCVCGTALGAVKYKGYIPWDDDVDVALPREDYEKFLQIAPSVLPEHIFLQNHRTDPKFPHLFSKLRNSNTTFIEEGVAHLDMNHGIYIDVFPLDGYPKSKKEQNRLRWKKKTLLWRVYCALKNNGNKKVAVRNACFRLLGCHKRTHKALAKLNRVLSAYPTDQSEIWCNHGNWQGEKEYAPKWQYGKGMKAEFEGLEVIIPEKYDEYLTQKYGDWRADLPKEKQVSHHIARICDPNKSFVAYQEKK